MFSFGLIVLLVSGLLRTGFLFYRAAINTRASMRLREEKDYVLTEAIRVLASDSHRRLH